MPDLAITYLSSRAYGGYATGISPLNPEPYAHQGGFAIKKVILQQIAGNAELAFDPAQGEVRAPWLAWGPYLWADGMVPRSDGLVWKCSDFLVDVTHPSADGETKVATVLFHFLLHAPTAAPWFRTP